MLQFEDSTQLRSWIFDTDTLRECRRRAVTTGDIPKGKLARKFASGFYRRTKQSKSSPQTPPATDCSPPPALSLTSRDQESLVRFHAYQLQTLVGPTAILADLRRSDVALATATTLFRRFYLSNSVAEFSPRIMAAACAFFACKLEEERVQISLLSHATALTQEGLDESSLCHGELAPVSVYDIEAYETILMEGVNYEFICHHPHASVGYLARDVAEFLMERHASCTEAHESQVHEHASDILSAAMRLLDQLNVVSDAPFLFAPGHIAFAIVAIVVEDNEIHFLGDIMQDYLVTRYPMQSEEDILSYTRTVSRVINLLMNESSMDLRQRDDMHHVMALRTRRLHRAIYLVRKISHPSSEVMVLRKRKRTMSNFVPPPEREMPRRKMVTPTYY